MTEKTIDESAKILFEKAEKDDIELSWDRFEKQQPQCGFGLLGVCCRNCNMGPCRIDPFGGVERGVCGATADTIVSRNIGRMIAAGAAAHSDHARDIVHTLLLTAEEKSSGYEIKDEGKLISLAKEFGIDASGSISDIAKELSLRIMGEFGMKKGSLQFIDRAPSKRKEIWNGLNVLPRGIDREIVEMMHRTNMGVDNDYANIILHGIRTALGDGWGGSMIATELSDVLFGTPKPIKSKVNLGVLENDMVNIIVHGHEPTLSEMLVEAVEDSDMKKLANEVGASGINLCGMCCTGNEILMRHGISVAGNFLNQELALVTGAVDAMVVDIQCIMPSLTEISKCYHTKIISTSPKAKFTGAEHIEYSEDKGLEIAKEIVKGAILNYKNRNKEKIKIPDSSPVEMVAGFSTETILDALGGTLDPLIGAIKSGKIKGIAAVVGCNNPKVTHDLNHIEMTKRLIENNVLVVQTGCSAIANAKAGFLVPEAANMAGEGLREICEALGIPPVLHMGSCVDISRILVVASEIAKALQVDISDLPVAGAAPEWMSEKAVSIGVYVVSSGIFTLLGTVPPVLGSKNVVDLLTSGAEDIVGGKFAVESDPIKGADLILEHIESKREKLGI